jgi:death on curing protein
MPDSSPHGVRYLDLADYLYLAGAALDTAPQAVFDVADLGLAESPLHAPAATFGAVEFYPDLVTKARVLVVHLTKNHPLPDANKRAAFLAMIEFLARNGRQLLATDVGGAIDMMVKIAGSEVDPGGDRELDQAAAPLRLLSRRLTDRSDEAIMGGWR